MRKVEPDGGEHLKAYDEQGRLIAEQDPLGAVSEYRYDEVGRLVALLPRMRRRRPTNTATVSCTPVHAARPCGPTGAMPAAT
nr:hypothetical protein GCM10020185_43470 [Pseudomonas brassicacearum subsp. brassicacearum]